MPFASRQVLSWQPLRHKKKWITSQKQLGRKFVTSMPRLFLKAVIPGLVVRTLGTRVSGIGLLGKLGTSRSGPRVSPMAELQRIVWRYTGWMCRKSFGMITPVKSDYCMFVKDLINFLPRDIVKCLWDTRYVKSIHMFTNKL